MVTKRRIEKSKKKKTKESINKQPQALNTMTFADVQIQVTNLVIIKWLTQWLKHNSKLRKIKSIIVI